MFRTLLSVVSVLFLISEASAQTARPSDLKGLWLITDYPSVAARPGESATFKLKLQNANLAPEQMALSVLGLPQGWKSEFRGGGQPIGAAMAATNESVAFELRIESPEGTDAKTVDFTVRAEGSSQKAALPLKLMLAGDIAPKLGLKTKLPSLKGTPKSSYEYNFTVSNDSGRNLLVSLSADVPANFQTTFTEGYGSQELSSIPIEAGQSKDLKVKVQPPSTVSAGKYDLQVRAMAEGASAQAPLSMEVTGQPKLRLAAADGRLSGSAEVGDTAQYNLMVFNDGTAPLEELEISSSPPTDWKIEFQPKAIPRLEAGQSREVQAMVTPSAKAIAGDYMTTFRANAKGESGSVDFRVSVKTSTMWGIVGLAAIAVALLVLLGAVARFGRR